MNIDQIVYNRWAISPREGETMVPGGTPGRVISTWDEYVWVEFQWSHAGVTHRQHVVVKASALVAEPPNPGLYRRVSRPLTGTPGFEVRWFVEDPGSSWTRVQ